MKDSIHPNVVVASYFSFSENPLAALSLLASSLCISVLLASVFMNISYNH